MLRPRPAVGTCQLLLPFPCPSLGALSRLRPLRDPFLHIPFSGIFKRTPFTPLPPAEGAPLSPPHALFPVPSFLSRRGERSFALKWEQAPVLGVTPKATESSVTRWAALGLRPRLSKGSEFRAARVRPAPHSCRSPRSPPAASTPGPCSFLVTFSRDRLGTSSLAVRLLSVRVPQLPCTLECPLTSVPL